MFRVIKENIIDNDELMVEAVCLSTDASKPSGSWAFGSLCLELDTGYFFYWDGDSWEKVGG